MGVAWQHGLTGIKKDAWQPEGFDQYQALYPNTPKLPVPAVDLTQRFAALWHTLESPDAVAQALQAHAARTTVVLVRGFLGNLMPGNLVAVQRALTQVGFDAVLWRGDTTGPLRRSVLPMAHALTKRGVREQLVMCGHSRGGHLGRLVLQASPELWARCRGVILSQTPRGPSLVLESLLLGLHQDSLRGWRRKLAESFQRKGLFAVGAKAGGLELARAPMTELLADIDAMPSSFPVMQTASWSSTPTTWLDSFHQRLGEIAPQVAHDGQFLLADLIWPTLPNVLLPNLDHAQPAMGGHGFEPARYWLAMLVLLFLDL